MTTSTETNAAPAATAATTAQELAVATAQGRIEAVIDGLRNLAALVADRPDIANAVIDGLTRARSPRILHFVSGWSPVETDIPAYIAALAIAAGEHGAAIDRHHGDKYAGIDAQFGFVQLHIYADLDKVGTVNTRTEQVTVTDWQPDPALAAIRTAATS